MAEYWGEWSQGSDGNGLRVGFDIAITNGNQVSWNLKVESEFNYQDNQTYSLGGNLSGSGSYFKGGAGVQYIRQGDYFWGNYGGGYWLNASIGGAYNGSNPSCSFFIVVPPTVPSAPSINTCGPLSQTSGRIWYNQPSNNGGANIDNYWGRIHNPSGGILWEGWIGTSGVWDVNGLTPNGAHSAFVYAHNSAGNSAWSNGCVINTPPNAPAAVTAVATSRGSDTQMTTTWANHASGTGPYDNVRVGRAYWGVDWSNITLLAGSAASFTDNSVTANRDWAYRIRAENSGGQSAWTDGPWVATSPAAPSAVTAVRGNGGTAVVGWTNNAYPTGLSSGSWQTVIEESDGAGGWTVKTTLAAGVKTWTDVAPRAGSTQYRLSTKLTGRTQTLASGTVVSPVVQVLAPPNPPGALSPNGIALDVSGATTLTWLHNPIDGSPQTKYQLQYRIQGAGTWTVVGPVTSAVSQHVLAAGTLQNGKVYEWQVQTWGAHATASAMSATATFTGSTKPTATVQYPAEGASLSTSTLAPTWTYYDAESTPQAQWRAQLLDAAGTTVLESLTGSGTATTVTFATPILDSTSYRVSVSVQDATGLWSDPDVNAFTVKYLPPEVVQLQANYDVPTGSIGLVLNPLGPVNGVSVAASSVTVERQIDGKGPWVTLAADIDPDSAIVDTQPTIHGTNCYRLSVLSTLPSSLVIDPAACVEVSERDNGFLTSGPAFDHLVVVACDLLTASKSARSKALHYFAGRARPVEFSGPSTSLMVDVKGTVTNAPTSILDMESMGETTGIVLWRDPTGRRLYGSLGEVSGSQVSMAFPDIWEVGFTVTEVDYDG